MVFDTTVDYYVFTHMSGVDDGEDVREDGDFRKITEKNGVKYGWCRLYDGCTPTEADETAENLWSESFVESNPETPEDYTVFDRRLPTTAITGLSTGKLQGVVVGQDWAIIPAEDFPFEE